MAQSSGDGWYVERRMSGTFVVTRILLSLLFRILVTTILINSKVRDQAA